MLRTIIFATLMTTPLAAQQTMDHTAHASVIEGVEINPITQPGQATFAAIEEIVAKLEANPITDWSVVNIAGLREHLRDMDLVFTSADVSVTDADDGQIYTITGEGRVLQAIQAMVVAHSGIMEGVDGWHYTPVVLANGVELTVTAPPPDLAKLRAIGFFGLMAQGMHHQDHHWMMASGADPHS